MIKTIPFLTLALFAISCACSNEQRNKKSSKKTEQNISQESRETKLVGALSKQEKLTADDKFIFQEAIKKFKTTNKYTPITVAKQVVAGVNYLFVCNVVSKDGSKFKEEVLIFKPLPHTKESAKILKTNKVK